MFISAQLQLKRQEKIIMCEGIMATTTNITQTQQIQSVAAGTSGNKAKHPTTFYRGTVQNSYNTEILHCNFLTKGQLGLVFLKYHFSEHQKYVNYF